MDRKSPQEQRREMTDQERLRHSCAHVLASAILQLWPEAQFAAGPAVDEGFYYDLDLSHRISPEDFPKIEQEMGRIIAADLPFERSEVSREEARRLAEQGRLGALGERPQPSRFKLDLLQDIPDGEVVSLYQNGDFLDLCAGPHVERTAQVGAFKLTTVASAYYKGDERNPQLQRVYGTAFASQKELDQWLAMMEEAKKRDHRKLGRELGIFMFDDDVGPGLPLWLPNGTALIEELERLAKETEFAAGYLRVRTPHICKESMYLTSGHLPYYQESMFPPMECDGVKYYLKPMNCPHHHKIYAVQPRSYRDLPIRLAEYGACYRHEQSGELFGLMRVRSMQMNDAHIYCSLEQFEQEFLAVCQMYLGYFKLFGLEKYLMRFSTHGGEGLGKKYVGESELWVKTEDLVRRALQNGGINFTEVPNEAAFYGPKIDVQVWSAIGREFTLATNQVDFAVPRRFGLTYKNAQNQDETPLCIHRAPLGTHERFIGFLIEHYAGAFPTWLAPEQVRILPITDAQKEYCQNLEKALKDRAIRVSVDRRNEKIGAKIRTAQLAKVPYMLVVGKNEVAGGTVAVRSRARGDEKPPQPVAEFVARVAEEIRERR
ncbi:threonine--tRNA ligase [bacterium]|nr:threonine--tRNA ligase [bacterium]